MGICLEVWGERALFTRPEFKAERVSYDVITPSAARGILDAIYWHPGMKWRIDRIRVCKPIRFSSIMRNEVGEKMCATNVLQVMNGANKKLFLNPSDCIQQRCSTFLRDVHYIIEAHFDMTDKAAPSDNEAKFASIINRRIVKGQCYHQPWFGVREFPVEFQLCEKIPDCPEDLKGEIDLGWMLLDMDYSDTSNIQPMFFHAVMHDGVIDVPAIKTGEVVA